MLHASTKKLIDRLAEMTELAKLDWTEGDDGVITYSTEGYSVSLTETPNEVAITSKDGKELERAGADELANTPAEDGGTYADIVAEMTKEAARVARGTEAAISTLLAGMQDTPAELETAPTEVETQDQSQEEQLQEDPGDETAVLSDDSVEAISTETETSMDVSDAASSESEEVADTVEEVEATDNPEPEIDAAPEMVADSAQHDETEPAPVDTEDTLASDDAPVEAEADTATESEDDVTEAVVRLADEVNQREDGGLDAAAASAVGAVALAAGLTTGTEEQTSETQEPEAPQAETVGPEMAETETVEAEPVPAIVTDTASAETHSYVPFGLEDTAENEPEPVVAQVESQAEVTMDEVAAPHEVSQAEEVSAPEVEAEAESEPEPTPELETVERSTDETPEQPVAPVWGSTQEHPSETVDEPVEAPETEVEAPSSPEALTDAPTFAEVTTPAEEAIEPAATEETVQPVAETPEPAQPQTYSLSGIGAGFGLGALSAKSEASGIPGPTSFGAPEEDKVVIDATEDVLPEIDGKPALPAGVAPLPSPTNADGASAAEGNSESEDGESDILKPRTRFNPWD